MKPLPADGLIVYGAGRLGTGCELVSRRRT